MLCVSFSQCVIESVCISEQCSKLTAGSTQKLSEAPSSSHTAMARRGWPVQAHQLALGPAGSGSPLHFHEDAVNALVYGVKRWDLLPPAKTLFSIEPPWCPPLGGSDSSSSSAGGATGTSTNVCGAPPEGGLRCVQLPGDLMYVPRRWGHSTLNLVEGVAIAVESDGSACLHGGCTHVVV